MRIRTLLVDDSPEVLEALGLYYRMHPEIDVVGTARSGHEALDFCARTPVHLVSLDIHLGWESGLTLCRALRMYHPDLFIAICSVVDAEEYRQAAAEHGAHYYLPKPLTSRDVDKLVQAVRASSRCRKEGEDSRNWAQELMTTFFEKQDR